MMLLTSNNPPRDAPTTARPLRMPTSRLAADAMRGQM